MTSDPGASDTQAATAFRVVEISREPIELYKILKFEGMAASGGQSRAAVASGQVRVNGVVETRKRKKIVSGDTIEFNEVRIRVERSPSLPANETSAEKEVQQAPEQQTDSTASPPP